VRGRRRGEVGRRASRRVRDCRDSIGVTSQLRRGRPKQPSWAGYSTTGTSNVAGAIAASFQSGKDSVTLALPLPASGGTRTWNQNRRAHSQYLSVTFATMALSTEILPAN